ncbi:hypothetical protein [Halanaerobium saccharolyticum]|nr:hypothetical protein [Halanaerobium saccharolyticum]
MVKLHLTNLTQNMLEGEDALSYNVSGINLNYIFSNLEAVTHHF